MTPFDQTSVRAITIRRHTDRGPATTAYIARLPTIVTSNLDFSEWGDAFPNRLLGAATLDRLRHGAYRLTLEGESYRSPRPMPGPRKSTVATGGKPRK